MSELAERDRVAKRGWAAPGGFHDFLVRLLKIALPAGVGVLLAYLLLAPLGKQKDASFLLDKSKVAAAHERLKMESAQYRGLDDKGRAFTLNAGTAVQPSSKQPIVNIGDMSARIQLNDGPALLKADRGRYNMDTQKVDVVGPLTMTAADGYKLETSNVNIDMNTHRLAGNSGVKGQMRLGSFSAGQMDVDMRQRRVTLSGRARLHIVQGGLRKKK
jgi:lipopolysaccharide export system protein LptC